jgi:D-alanyl-D-alanine carboxypeptidase/D-alanyl-D-alanine-endopeptidase (penicillin-binding protein 4)
MFTCGLEPSAEIRGTFGVDKKPKRVDCSNKFPELTCAHHFLKWLESHGMKVTGGCADDRLFKMTTAQDSLKTLGSTESPELRRIVYETNHISNNLYAETLLRTLGKEFKGNGCYDSSYVAVRNILKDLGVDTSRGYTLQDGSGLSRQNFISADFLCRFLEAMMESPVYETYVKSLPSPGGPGTLGYNMKNHPSELKARIHAKSGSMNGVRCYSGYILPGDGNKDNTIIFSIMVNNCTAPSWKVRPLMDKMMGILALQN